jgi:hypothetical protein
LGGAFSIDKEWRRKEEASLTYLTGKDHHETLWWSTETINFIEADLAKANALEKGPVDLMFTHDCPTGVDVPGIHAVDKWKWPETWQNRDLLREVVDVARPKLLVHGHYHTAYEGGFYWEPGEDGQLDGCKVIGLSNDGFSGFAVVLDLDALFPVE